MIIDKRKENGLHVSDIQKNQWIIFRDRLCMCVRSSSNEKHLIIFHDDGATDQEHIMSNDVWWNTRIIRVNVTITIEGTV